MAPRRPKLLLATLAVGTVLTGIFAGMLVRFRADLREEVRRTIIGRDAAILQQVALRQIAESEARVAAAVETRALLSAVPAGMRPEEEGVLAVVVFDAQGAVIESVPRTLLFAELAPADFLALLGDELISRFHENFPLDRYFTGVDAAHRTAPVLEVLLPLYGHGASRLLGFAQYYLDARALSAELAAIDSRMNRQTAATLAIGIALIAAVLTSAHFGLQRAQRLLAERTERLARANFELTLSAKASALGQITSHLIHGLQGSVAGLRAVVSGGGVAAADWQSAVTYTERMQAIIAETVGLLSDTSAHASYELTGDELAGTIRERNSASAARKGVVLSVQNGDGESITVDGHRGGLLCLIASNLVQNAIDATPPGRRVLADLARNDGTLVLSVTDEGMGIPESIRPRLFEPGATSRPGGTGLGLAISRLLARQIDADLELVRSGPTGTAFRVTLRKDADQSS